MSLLIQVFVKVLLVGRVKICIVKMLGEIVVLNLYKLLCDYIIQVVQIFQVDEVEIWIMELNVYFDVFVVLVWIQ